MPASRIINRTRLHNSIIVILFLSNNLFVSIVYGDSQISRSSNHGNYRKNIRKISTDSSTFEIISSSTNPQSGLKVGCVGEKKEDYEEILHLFTEDEVGYRQLARLDMFSESNSNGRSLAESGLSWPVECLSSLIPDLNLVANTDGKINKEEGVDDDEDGTGWLSLLSGCNCPPGRNGEDGLPGDEGEVGKTGYPGKDGSDGLDGREGRIGGKGEQGIPGVRGDKGQRGDVGEAGVPGRDGLAGFPGRNGRQLLPSKSVTCDPVDTIFSESSPDYDDVFDDESIRKGTAATTSQIVPVVITVTNNSGKP